METAAVQLRVRPSARGPLIAGLLAVGTCALIGALLAAQAIKVGPIRPHRTPGIGESVRTSFGVIAVVRVEKVGGLGAKSMSGMTHGIQNIVGPNKMQVEVSLQISNLLQHTVQYSPNQYFLRVGRGSPAFAVTSSSVRYGGVLQPSAAIDATFSFIVPRSTAPLELEFRDRDNKRIAIRLGHASRAGPSTPPR